MATEKICEICGEKSKALHMHMKKHLIDETALVREPGFVDGAIKQIEKKLNADNPIVRQPKQEIVKLLMDSIPALFDQFPRGSLSLQGVEGLVDKILKLYE